MENEEVVTLSAYQALSIINDIAEQGSRTEKQRLLEKLGASHLGRFVLKWTYDPFITYGLTPPHQEGEGRLEFRPALVQKLLEELAQRKLTGNAAQREVAEVMMAFDKSGAELLWRILSKDLKCGIGTTTINAAVPGLIPTFAVMRAHKFEEKRIKTWPQIVEPKLDGYRFTFLCRDGHGGFFSRSGIRQEAADHLVEPMIETALAAATKSQMVQEMRDLLVGGQTITRENLNFMADGEMIMPGDFNANGALRRKGEQAEDAKFHIFDIMSYADFDAVGSVGLTYLDRRKLVEEFASKATSPLITKTERYYANSFEEIHALYEKFRARGLEGAMVKNPDGLYDKKKSHGWLKIKAEETEDLRVVGAYPGEPDTKYENCLGGLIVVREHAGAMVEVRVGGGFTDVERVELWEAFQRDEAVQHWPAPGPNPEVLGRLIEVEFHEVTPDGSLRHPRFKRFRDDKAGEIETKEAA